MISDTRVLPDNGATGTDTRSLTGMLTKIKQVVFLPYESAFEPERVPLIRNAIRIRRGSPDQAMALLLKLWVPSVWR